MLNFKAAILALPFLVISLFAQQVTPPGGGGGGGGGTSVTLLGTAGQITLTGACVSSTTITCTFSLPNNVVLPGTINSLTITTSTGALTIANAKTLTVNNSVIFTGTDGSTLTFGSGGTIFYTSTTLGCAQMPVLTGDISNSSCVLTVTGINGGAVPTSAAVLGTNSSKQPIAASAAGIVGLFSGCSGTLYLGADGACHAAGGGSSSSGVNIYPYATSTTSQTPGAGPFTFTTQSGLSYTSAQTGVYAISGASGANFMGPCTVTSYSGTTLVLTSCGSGGTGAHTDWQFSLPGTAATFTNDGTLTTLISATGLFINVQNVVNTATILSRATDQAGTNLAITTTSSSGTTYTGTMTPTLTTYTANQVLTWDVGATGCTAGAVTINVDTLGAKSIKEADGTTNPVTADCTANRILKIAYDGTLFRIIGGGQVGGSGSGSVTSVATGSCLTGGPITTTGTIAFDGSVNPQTATYQVLAGDFSACKTITVASGTFTITLVASTSQPANGQSIQIINYGSGTVTIARSGQNINGGTSSLTIGPGTATSPSGAFIKSDGTNYFAVPASSFPATTCTNQVVTALAVGTAMGTCTTITSAYVDTSIGLTASPLSQFASTTSAQLAGVLSNETGTGLAVFNTSPALVTPALGTPASGVMTNVTGVPIAAIVNGTQGGLLAGGGSGNQPQVSAAGTAKQIAISGGTGASSFIDFPQVFDIPAANCVSTVAGSGWSTTLTPGCVGGSNNLGGTLPFVDASTAQFNLQIPGDWDTASQPFIKVVFNSGSNTTGTVIFNAATACTKEDGSVTSDPAFTTADALATKTMATATRGWSSTIQMTQVTSGNNCVPGGQMIVKITRATDTAGSAVNVDKAVITVPRLLTVQAN